MKLQMKVNSKKNFKKIINKTKLRYNHKNLMTIIHQTINYKLKKQYLIKAKLNYKYKFILDLQQFHEFKID